jgi:hypothetical protein
LSLDELSSEKVFPPQKHHQVKKEKRKQIEIQMAGHATTLKYGQSSTHRCFLGVCWYKIARGRFTSAATENYNSDEVNDSLYSFGLQ